MEKNISLIIIISSLLLLSCAHGPTDAEIIELVKKEQLKSGVLLLEMKIERKGGPRKPEGYNITVYPITVNYRYVSEGLKYGWIAGSGVPYFEQYYEDTEWKVITEFLIGKDQFGEWKIFDSRSLEFKEVQKHRRPASKSMGEFYKDRMKTIPTP